MLRDRAARRVATALFLDVVGSTRIAADVGDRRWRELVAAFRGVVRRHLKRHGGREVDTAGDGFFATFGSPAGALRAAAAIVAEVQGQGLDVRCGLHTGELERIDGRLGGIGAHIAARVMAEAGPAQVLATSTVRDLVVGGAVDFEAAGDFELKGVPGTWALHRVASVDGTPLPSALDPEDAASRRVAGMQAPGRARLVALGGAGLLVAVAAVAAIQFARAGDEEPPIGSPSASAPPPPPPVALLKIDPLTRDIVATVPDASLPPFGGSVQVVDGNLWHWYERGGTLLRRDLETGEILASVELPPETSDVLPAFGSLWIAHGIQSLPSMIDRHDVTSGRRLEQIDPEEQLYDMTIGDDAIYLLTTESEIIEVDPFSGEVVDRDSTGTATSPAYAQYASGSIWLSEGADHRLSEFDPVTDTVIGTVEIPQFGLGAAAHDPKTGILWIADRRNSTLTPFDLERREAGPPIGLKGVPRAFAFGFDAVWLAAEGYVYRIDSWTYEGTEIQMPEGVVATSVGIDEMTLTIWVSTCAVDCDDF